MPSPAKSRLRGASLLITLQLTSRLITFTANQVFLLRHVTAPQLGHAARLEASAATVLFLARDGLRVAVPRVRRPEPQTLVNLGYLSAAVGAVVLAVGLLGWGGGRLGAGFAESAAVLARCLVLFLAVRSWADGDGENEHRVLPFALGQLAYALTLLITYTITLYRLASALKFSLLPRASSSGYLDGGAVRLAASVSAQGIVKHLLTQGDTLLVAVLAPPRVQGVYALANNYGGLLARLLFQPIEESCRGYFSLLLSPEKQSSTEKDDGPSEAKVAAVVEASRSLAVLARLYLLLSVIVVSLGPFAAPPLLALVAGGRWSDAGAGRVLATYSLYVPFLALNGLAEAFVASVATERHLRRQSLAMAVFSIVFAVAAGLLMRVLGWGAHGLVVANMVNLLCRICWCAVFIKDYFGRRSHAFSLTALFPRHAFAAASAIAAVLVRLRLHHGAESEPIRTLAMVAAWAIPLLAITAFLERDLLLQCLHSVRGKEASKP
ncbi:oligosaccharidyl-lipid flippase [Ophiocordyceps camponoti-floridani]|uniref:Man(5)GlcNAc(2)-PP-dolichol translocation protein RFT1 n=1 Tax=Ophiocordyceps camponoti-floridani TaxID=2030778 RepID=A0A8H4QAM6_9HYPO|nr:oligosaccharidyl-lipid flippase [Ophiocordyceps camponoti-floridani]